MSDWGKRVTALVARKMDNERLVKTGAIIEKTKEETNTKEVYLQAHNGTISQDSNGIAATRQHGKRPLACRDTRPRIRSATGRCHTRHDTRRRHV